MMDKYMPADNLRGFGSADVTTPFHYGSVADGMLQAPSLEQKLKKKYWKTKQTVIQKLGKNQDEFVVAGDAEIDTKLEKAYHLRSSCQELLNVLDKYSARMKTAAYSERAMGEYLSAYSEMEYTNAGEVMQNVGKLQQEQAKERLIVVPSLQRLQHDFATFMYSAIKDLTQSIQTLEKARTEYRAALLWMRDVSEKLKNPDYKDQLTKFREAQAAVKGTRIRFEKLKTDLTEKIEMVSASRCNLLSRSLPYYQKDILLQLDKTADAYHRVLADLRTHHNHQYKVKKIVEEIHHLESEEGLEQGIISPEVGSEVSAPSLCSAEESTSPTTDDTDEDDDEPLIDIGETGPSAVAQQGGESSEGDPERKAEELNLLGDLGDFVQQTQGPSAADELNDLLQLGLSTDQPDSQQPASDEKSPADQLFDDWNSFSAFMPATKPGGEAPTSGGSDWEKEFRQTGPAPELLMDIEGLEAQKLQHQDGGTIEEKIRSLSTEKQSTSSPGVLALGDGLLEPAREPQQDGNEPTLPGSLPTEASGLDSLPGLPPSSGGQSGSLETMTTHHAASEPMTSTGTATSETALSDDVMSLSLASPPGKEVAPGKEGVATTGLESLDAALFQLQSSLPASQVLPMATSASSTPSMPAPLIPSPNAATQKQQPITGPTMTDPTMFRSPLMASQGLILPPQPMQMWAGQGPGKQIGSGAALSGAGVAQPGSKPASKGSRQGDKKETAWMNVFAHLDPLVNEKA